MTRGRKAKTWIDVYHDAEATYQPNTVGAIGLVGVRGLPSDDTPFIRVIEGLVNMQATHPPTDHIQFQTQVRLRYVICDFLCRRFNIAPPWPLVDGLGKPLKRSTLKYIKMLGAEATALFNLVADVYGSSGPIAGVNSAAEVWGRLMLEGTSGLLDPAWAELVELDELTKRAAIAQYRRNTKQLLDRETTPYKDNGETMHKAFFDVAMQHAESIRGDSGDRFSIFVRSYKPYLQARSDLAKYLESKKSNTKMLRKMKSSNITLTEKSIQRSG